ncbi:hypothetical protein SETIT_2G042000v2 [Setaria italica]|uniref:Uncharacterized protein n=1 Tax=Setaria italica TaxID=4555 RepID=A0A368PVA6_SETIT|nr:hypothetical protein SETIT_2G042000v2 [Setaria italica]
MEAPAVPATRLPCSSEKRSGRWLGAGWRSGRRAGTCTTRNSTLEGACRRWCSAGQALLRRPAGRQPPHGGRLEDGGWTWRTCATAPSGRGWSGRAWSTSPEVRASAQAMARQLRVDVAQCGSPASEMERVDGLSPSSAS